MFNGPNFTSTTCALPCCNRNINERPKTLNKPRILFKMNVRQNEHCHWNRKGSQMDQTFTNRAPLVRRLLNWARTVSHTWCQSRDITRPSNLYLTTGLQRTPCRSSNAWLTNCCCCRCCCWWDRTSKGLLAEMRGAERIHDERSEDESNQTPAKVSGSCSSSSSSLVIATSSLISDSTSETSPQSRMFSSLRGNQPSMTSCNRRSACRWRFL